MKKLFYVLLTSIILWGCSTFKGEIPINSDQISDYYISPSNMDGINDNFTVIFSIDEIKGLKITGYDLSIISPTGQIVYHDEKGTPYVKKLVNIKKVPVVKVPTSFTWEGKDSSGSFLDDGLYLLTLKAWDNKGNSGAIEPYRVHIDNTPPMATLNIPFTTFSPNTDTGLQKLTIYQESTVEELWSATFMDETGHIYLENSWSGVLSNLDIDGIDNSNNLIPDGEYKYVVTSTDLAGNSFKTSLDKIVIDRKDSDLFFKNDKNYFFSPNNDGINDTVDIELNSLSNSKFTSLSVDIIDIYGRVVKSSDLSDKNYPIIYTFDGIDQTEELLDPGTYYSRFNVTLPNGKKSNLVSNPIIIDIDKPIAVLSLNSTIFSPEGDGFKDTIQINQSTSSEAMWLGEILDSSNRVVFSKKWEDRAISFIWDALDSSSNQVPDGIYSYRVSSTDDSGNNGVYRSEKFEVDRTLTPISMEVVNKSFSPNNDGINDTLEINLNVEVLKGIQSWNIAVKDLAGDEIYYKEGHNNVPKKFFWNGDPDQTNIVDGEYSVDFEVIYTKGNRPKVSTESNFIVDLTPPEILITIPDILFSPDGDGVNDFLDIKIIGKDNHNDFSYSAKILDPTGLLFKAVDPKEIVNDTFRWDGKSNKKELVQSASDYTIVVEAVDSLGNKTVVSKNIPIDILVLKDGDKLKIVISSIIFKPNTADFVDIDPVLFQKNVQTLKRLSEILKKYSAYQIGLEGHGVRVFWDSPTKWLKEEQDILLPLSIKRADVIKDALVALGVKKDRMITSGYGGYQPVVPHSDLDNRWKNRRVEFILVK